ILPPPRLALPRLVFAGRHPRHRRPVLPCPPPPDAARAQPNVGGRRRLPRRVPEDPAARVRPHAATRLPTAAPSPLAGALRQVLAEVPRSLPAQPGQPALRPAPAPLLRPEPPG